MQIRDRIREFLRVPARELRNNPRNWRKHPVAQERALQAMLAEVGFAGAVLARETEDGLELIDGHLRVQSMADQHIPVLVLDVTEDEANKLLATFDPLAAMAEANNEAFKELLTFTALADQELTQYLNELANESLQYLPTERANDPQQEWQGMPEFIQENQKAWKKIYVHLRDPESLEAFAKLMGQPLTEKTRSIWFPAAAIESRRYKRYVDES